LTVTGLSENNRKAKYYQLTVRGRADLRAETTRWTQYAEAVFKVSRAASRTVPLPGRMRFLICPLRGHPARNDGGDV